MRTCVVDIETSSLDAIGAGVLLCAVVKPYGKREKVFRGDDYKVRWGQEKPLLEALRAELVQYDLWIGHNIINFDYPWLRSRVKFFDLPELPRPFLYDTMKGFRRLGYKTVLNGFGKPSAGLAHVTDFFGFEQEKTGIYPRAHWEVVWGKDDQVRKNRMDELVRHCVADVSMTQRIYDALLPVDYAATIKRAR